MKFKGTGVVWDPLKDRPLCRFDKNGECEVTDERTVQKLLSLGYESLSPNYVDVEFEAVEPEKVVDADPADKVVDVAEIKKPAPRKRKTKKEVAE